MRPMTASDGQDDAGTQGTEPRRRRVFPSSRRRLVGVVAACALVAAGGISACGAPGSAVGAADDGVSLHASAGTGSAKVAAAGLPQAAATPRVAVMPKRASRKSRTHSASPSPSASRSASKSASASPSASQAPTSGDPMPSASSPAPTAPVTTGSANCTNPSFSSSAQYGIWNQSPYYVYNNMWGISGYSVSQTIYACSYGNWYVTADMNNNNGDGHVKTYPNSQRDFNNTAISSPELSDQHVRGDEPGHRDLRRRLRHLAQRARDVRLDRGHDLDPEPRPDAVWFGRWNRHGRRAVLRGLEERQLHRVRRQLELHLGDHEPARVLPVHHLKGWIPASSTLSQVGYGVELVSTNNAPATFSFSNYSVNAS